MGLTKVSPDEINHFTNRLGLKCGFFYNILIFIYHLVYSDYCLHLYCYIHVLADTSFSFLQVIYR